MFRIGIMPDELQDFFEPLRKHLTKPQFEHFWRYVTAVAAFEGRKNVASLFRNLDHDTVRQKLNDFLAKSPWRPEPLLEDAARFVIENFDLKEGDHIFVVIDPTKLLKRGKHMAACESFFDPDHNRAVWGQRTVECGIIVNGVMIPWQTTLYLPKRYARKTRRSWKTLQEIAALMIEALPEEWTKKFKLTVLLDAQVFCESTAQACEQRGITYIARVKKNRAFWPESARGKRTVSRYATGLLRHQGQDIGITRNGKTQKYRIAKRAGRMRKAGAVALIASRRLSDGSAIYLATNDTTLSAREAVEQYGRRWQIEVLIKQLKDSLGLDEHQTRSERGASNHLHLVMLAYLLILWLRIRSESCECNEIKAPLQMTLGQGRRLLRQIIVASEIKRICPDAKTLKIAKLIIAQLTAA